jgi:cytochrome subunit of sulfide dehydrogenase
LHIRIFAILDIWQEISMKTTILLAAALIAVAGPAQAQNEGRLLASNCFQCHGTNGKPTSGGFDRLAGESVSEIYNELERNEGKRNRIGIPKSVVI